MLGFAGVRLIETSVAFVTVSVVDCVTMPMVAVIVDRSLVLARRQALASGRVADGSNSRVARRPRHRGGDVLGGAVGIGAGSGKLLRGASGDRWIGR